MVKINYTKKFAKEMKKFIPEDAILSEESLKETWLNEEEDEAWKDL